MSGAIPHCCPVCNGTGQVPYNFYESGPYQAGAFVVATENCRSCNASGIVWHEPDEEDEG